MPKPLTDTVAAEVRAQLARHNIARTDAAAACGISRTLLWSRLRAETPFKVPELEALAALMKIPVSTFLPDADPVRAA